MQLHRGSRCKIDARWGVRMGLGGSRCKMARWGVHSVAMLSREYYMGIAIRYTREYR